MPQFNSRGDLAWGLGRYWYDDDRTIAQECNTLQPGCVVALSDGTIVWKTGTVKLTANGRRMWALVPYPADGYVDALGRTLPPGQDTAYSPDTVGPDGAVCLRPFSNAFADVLEVNGTVWRLSSADAFDIQLLGQHRALWRESGPDPYTLHSLGLSPPPATPEGEYYAPTLIAKPDGTWGLLYQSGTGGALVFDGRIVADGVDFFRPTAIFLADVLHVAWALDQSESFGPHVTFTPRQFAALPLIADRLHPPDPEPPDPEPPDPEPPEPPDPEPPDGGDVDMTPQQIALRGPAGLFARIDPSELGQGMWRGYPIHFDRDTVGAHETFELSKPDDRYQITHVATGAILGADATSNSGDVCRQFYTSGGDVVGRGAYESWTVFRLRAGGTICALIEYDQDGVIYCSADLTVEEL